MAENAKKKNKDKCALKQSKTKSQETDHCAAKKPSMKTASDVISRLLWDDSLPQEKFTVGYIDRFDGIVEKPFTSLDWQDPAIVDNHTLALPKHRIQYFKYNNRKVWDKTTRKDIIFGSTGNGISIYEFMASVDEEKLSFRDEDLPVGIAASEKSDDIESEDEYDLSNRANFFIAARIKSENTVKNLKEVSDYIKMKDPLLEECCIPPERLHLTLCILKLDSPADVADTVAAMKFVAAQDLPLVTLNLEGLDNFHYRVLYSRVVQNEDLFRLRHILTDALIGRTITDKFSFVPHVTVAKLSRPIARLRHSNYIDQYLYLKFEDNDFGSEVITDLYLCEMGDGRSEDGFYRCACEIPLTKVSDNGG